METFWCLLYYATYVLYPKIFVFFLFLQQRRFGRIDLPGMVVLTWL